MFINSKTITPPSDCGTSIGLTKFIQHYISTGPVYILFALYPRFMLRLLYNSPFALYDIAKMDYLFN